MLDQSIQFLITGLTIGSIYALVGLGFALIYNASDVVNFAQGEFVMIGAMSAIFIHASGIPYAAAIIMAAMIVMAVGIALEKLAIERARDATVVSTIIITIGASIFLRGAALIIWGKDIYSFPSISGDDPIRLGNITILPQSLWIIAFTCALVFTLRYFFQKTMTGKAILACSYNKKAAYLMGIEVRHMLALAYGISGLLGGIAGILITPITYMTYGAGVMLGLKGFCASILGGMGNPMGAVIGGLILGIVESLGAGFISSGYKDAISFCIILLVLFLKPTGIFGKTGTERV